MSPRLRRILAQIGSFVLAGVLLYLALRDVDFEAVAQALREADYFWLIPIVVITLISHVLRAWRWQVLLEALPLASAQESPRRISLKITFYSVMIGYMVNYAAPRMGEVARAANLAAKEKLSFSGAFGTVVVERILDSIVLLLGLVSVFFLLLDQLALVNALFITPAMDQFGKIPALALLGLMLGITLLVFLLYRYALQSEDSRLRLLWYRRVQPLWVSFKDGLATVLRSPRRVTLVFSTVALWFCYLLMAYLPFVLFNMTETFSLSLLDAWVIMMLGAVGIAIPSPGGIGSYHYITIQGLVVLYGVAQAEAASYAVLVHGGQMILYIGVGFLCLLLQGSSLGNLRQRTQAIQEEHHATDQSTLSR